MKKVGNFWIPDKDKMFNKQMKDMTFVMWDCRHFMEIQHLLDKRRTFVDVGAHVGTWSKQLSGYYDQVYSFEPNPYNYECFLKNLEGIENVNSFNVALGEYEKKVEVGFNGTNSGDSHIVNSGGSIVDLKPLDSYGLTSVDFLKIDVQGYDLAVLLGAKNTLVKSKPVVMVEYTPGKPYINNRSISYGYPCENIPELMKWFGFKLYKKLNVDLIFVWGG